MIDRMYRLDENHDPVPISDLTEIELGVPVGKFKQGDIEVSTVFLSIDHQWGDGPPILFETMVFGGVFDQAQERYCTWDEAAAGHERWVETVRGSIMHLEEGISMYEIPDSDLKLLKA